MKRTVLAAILVAMMVAPALALDQDSSLERIALYPGLGVMIESAAMGTSAEAQALFDFENTESNANVYLGARVYYGKTETTTYIDQDLYASLDLGLRFMLFKNKGPEATSLAFRLGLDLGGGYSNHELSNGTVNGYYGFIYEPNAKLEYQIRDASFILSGGFRGIVSPTGGWVFKKNAAVFSFGYFYHLESVR